MREYAPGNRPYELMTIFSPDVADEGVTEQLEVITGYIRTAGGAVYDVLQDAPWGRRRFAYPIRFQGRDVRDGFYSVIHFDLVPGQVSDVERDLKLDERVLRFLLTSHEVKEPAKTDPLAEGEEAPAPVVRTEIAAGDLTRDAEEARAAQEAQRAVQDAQRAAQDAQRAAQDAQRAAQDAQRAPRPAPVEPAPAAAVAAAQTETLAPQPVLDPAGVDAETPATATPADTDAPEVSPVVPAADTPLTAPIEAAESAPSPSETAPATEDTTTTDETPAGDTTPTEDKPAT